MKRTTSNRQTPTDCPWWCDVNHPPGRLAAGNYHHDGPAMHLMLNGESVSHWSTSTLHVKPALFVPAPGEATRRNVPQVEIQTDQSTILELDVRDALTLAQMILEVCAITLAVTSHG